MKYKVRGALGGGFGGCDNAEWEEIKCGSYDEAIDIARQIAIEVYESYEGNNGIRSVDDIMYEDDLDEEDAIGEYQNDIESWIDYEAELIEEE